MGWRTYAFLDFLDASMYLRGIRKAQCECCNEKRIMKLTKTEDEHDAEIHWNQLRKARVHLYALAMFLFVYFIIRSITIVRG